MYFIFQGFILLFCTEVDSIFAYEFMRKNYIFENFGKLSEDHFKDQTLSREKVSKFALTECSNEDDPWYEQYHSKQYSIALSFLTIGILMIFMEGKNARLLVGFSGAMIQISRCFWVFGNPQMYYLDAQIESTRSFMLMLKYWTILGSCLLFMLNGKISTRDRIFGQNSIRGKRFQDAIQMQV